MEIIIIRYDHRQKKTTQYVVKKMLRNFVIMFKIIGVINW